MNQLFSKPRTSWQTKNLFRVLMCGDRNMTDNQTIIKIFQHIIQARTSRFAIDSITIIHGAAPGADTLAGQEAKLLGCNVEEYPANWKKHGLAAGPIRNREMLVSGKPDLVIAFHSDISKSAGTRNMIDQTHKAGIPWTIIDENGFSKPDLDNLTVLI